jgi:hypothetical protein
MFVRAPAITTTCGLVAASTIQPVDIACAKVGAKAATRLAAIPFPVDNSVVARFESPVFLATANDRLVLSQDQQSDVTDRSAASLHLQKLKLLVA